MNRKKKKAEKIFIVFFSWVILAFIVWGVWSVIKTESLPENIDFARKGDIEDQFSSWNGSHPGLTDYIKENMNDPDSYEHVETKFKKEGADSIYVITKFRGKNAFGGKILTTIHALVDYDNNVIKIISQK